MGRVTREDHITILTLRKKGVSVRAVSQMVGHSPATVQKYARTQPGCDVFFHPRASMFDAHKDEIESTLNADRGKQSHNVMTAMRAFRDAHPEFAFGKTAFYDFVRCRCDLTREPKLARIPLDHEAGDAQIDFCAVTYYRRGRRVDGRQFTMSFPQSGMSFVQIFPSENQQCLFEGMSNIFEYIGFVPKSILFDNASTAVLSVGGKGKDAVPTKEYEDFAAYYGFEMRFCNPSSGWEKGCVERDNETARKRYFTPPPRIDDEEPYNRSLLARCLDDARHSPHYMRRVTKAELFEADCRHGLELPENRYDCRRSEVRVTDKCAMIQLRQCRYSVSDRYPRRPVIVKYGAFHVDIYTMTGEHICRHRRSYLPGSITIDPTMYADALAARPRAVIRESDNEYTTEILTDIVSDVSSARPAAREDVFIDGRGLSCLTSPQMRSVLLYGMKPYNSEKEVYDGKIRSNGCMVQAAVSGKSVCRCRDRQKKR